MVRAAAAAAGAQLAQAPCGERRHQRLQGGCVEEGDGGGGGGGVHAGEGGGRQCIGDEGVGLRVPRWDTRSEKRLHPGLHVVQAGGGPEGCIFPRWVWSSLPNRKGRRGQHQSRAHHAGCGGRAGVGARVRRSRPGERTRPLWIRQEPAGGHAVVS
eukprot:scaffold93544_cov72-Phaeocystis_antarctica.AAC.1